MPNLSTIVFIVEGSTEIAALRGKLQKEFHVTPALRKIPCNGKSVTPEIYANKAHGVLQVLLSSRFTDIVIILDKERGSNRDEDFADALKSAVVEKLLSETNHRRKNLESVISVFVPDLMFENWIIADVMSIKQRFESEIKSTVAQKEYDGTHGARQLANMMRVKYRKTLHGPRYFKQVDFVTCQTNSPSFKKLYEKCFLCA